MFDKEIAGGGFSKINFNHYTRGHWLIQHNSRTLYKENILLATKPL